MLDKCGRNINYLRISVTDRCNLRCMYCMPNKGIKFMPESNLLKLDEIYRIVKLTSELGMSKVRITGGEPLIREGIVDLIKDIKSLPNINEVCITTNGILLAQYLTPLIKAGLDRVNISLDTLKEDVYSNITRGGDLKSVIDSLNFAVDKGLKVKINTVIMEGFNSNEIMDFVAITENNPIDVRFIELMPIGEGKSFKSISTQQLKNIISKNSSLTACDNITSHEGPASYFKTEKGIGKIGFISAMSHSFCENCNRIRLTSEGFLKQCLHWNSGTDLRSLIRNGISDAELKEVIMRDIFNKPIRHKFNDNDSASDNRLMYQIGG